MSNDVAPYFLLAVVTIIALFALLSWDKTRKKQTEELWSEYQKALNSGDRQKALLCGREYYKHIRGSGRLTIYDEQAIANDLSVMKQNSES